MNGEQGFDVNDVPDETAPTPDSLLVLLAEQVPVPVGEWLTALSNGAALASLELLANGDLVIQLVPGVDPRFVAQVRVLMAQHEDVLRRLT
jgi:hypothetical protein